MSSNEEEVTMSTNQIEEFKARLQNGDFADATGAKKSIGRNTKMSEKTKEAARAAADEFFAKGGSKPAAKKTAAKKAAKAGRTPQADAAPASSKPGKGKAAEAQTAQAEEEQVLGATRRTDKMSKTMKNALERLGEAKNLGADPAYIAAKADEAARVVGHCIEKVLAYIQPPKTEAAPPVTPVISSPPVPPPAQENTNMQALGHAAAAANGVFPQGGPPMFQVPPVS